MNGDTLWRRWLLEVRALSLVTQGSAREHANQNLRMFAAREVQECGADVRQISDFLLKTYREYWRKAWACGATGWFYAWSDELSGTLRCSMAAVGSVDGRGHLPVDLHFLLTAWAENAARTAFSSPSWKKGFSA